ncbi:cobalt-zinc-cadmium efflux system outer membrane protein [Phenylobacterium haematophilum]|uniref:Cobalt-zinc-cadmium efflux system outer membrane protein n=1 Tax=Phenylobacterium haematophilum TaxID=98513 RepID=A0A840A6E1_9CAUL|nr:TolC family protein [Phenylobacterium haematophilum]MBB3893051.1 cobalt-zinc-cadmium efflux system outer membrane protein [Phenylobacterium haematophilum]
MPPHHVRLAALLAAGGLACAHPVLAAPAPSFQDLLAQSAQAPRRAESQAQIAAAQGRLDQAGAWRNPELSLDVENFAGKGPMEGLDSAETTLSLSQTLELGGKRGARIDGARRDVDLARARDAQARADYAAALAVGYAEAEAAQLRADQARELLEAAQSDARAADLLVEAGKEARLRGLQAQADAQSAQAGLDQALAARDAAFGRLSAQAGSGDTYDSLTSSLLSADAAIDAEPVDTPAVLSAQADRDSAAAKVRVEQLQSRPDLTVSAGVRRFAGDGSTAMVAGAALPLPLFDRNRGNTAAARAELAAAEARLAQARLDAVADLAAARSHARSASAQASAAAAGEAAAAEAYRLARIGYEAGRLPLLELTAARRALAAARLQTLEARLARVRALAEAARLAGKTPFGA